ncbi:MAG: PD40 domain-containing protein [Anaerolineae bacterium]|nr:PD40 domain-containing protein [Anaerolineae bacterium]
MSALLLRALLHAAALCILITLLATGLGYGLPSVRLLYYANQNGNYDIYLLDTNRLLAAALTRNPGEDSRPIRSPDGTQIAFFTRHNDQMQLQVMTSAGRAKRILAQISGQIGANPAWSPDGNWIAYSDNSRQRPGIVRVRADGDEARRITDFRADWLAWSPDGLRLAFVADCDNNCDLYVVNVDGSDLRRLTRNGTFDMLPAWSPDGERLMFMSNRDGYFDLYLIALDCNEHQRGGCPAQRLTNDRSFDGYPAWSPDGTRLLFSSDRTGNFDIFTLDTACLPMPERCEATLRQLTNQRSSERSQVWSPDGDRIAFISAFDLYVMNADGSEQRRMIGGVLPDQVLGWLP